MPLECGSRWRATRARTRLRIAHSSAAHAARQLAHDSLDSVSMPSACSTHLDLDRDVVENRIRSASRSAHRSHRVTPAQEECARRQCLGPGTRRERRASRGGRSQAGGHGNDSSSRGAAHTHADARKPRAYSPMRHPEEALDDRLYGVSSSRHTKYQPVQCRNTKGCCQASALVAEGERMRSTRRHSKCRPAGSAARAGWIGCGATHQARP